MTSDLLSLDLAMVELMSRWPQTITVLLSYGLGCVGCSMAAFDTLADVIRIYHLPQERFIGDLYATIQRDRHGA